MFVTTWIKCGYIYIHYSFKFISPVCILNCWLPLTTIPYSFVLFYRQQLALTSYQKQCTWRIEQWVIFSVCSFLHTAGWKPGSQLWSPSEVLNKISRIGSWEKFITKLFLALWFLIFISHPKSKFVCKILVSLDLLCCLDLEKKEQHIDL